MTVPGIMDVMLGDSRRVFRGQQIWSPSPKRAAVANAALPVYMYL